MIVVAEGCEAAVMGTQSFTEKKPQTTPNQPKKQNHSYKGTDTNELLNMQANSFRKEMFIHSRFSFSIV